MARTVLVTGGTRGIGAAIAASFAARGDTVVVAARREADGCPHAFVAADLREPEACEALVQRVVEETGRLDVLVNNAGGTPSVDTATASPRLSEKIVRLNLLAPLWLSQYANAVMQGQDTGGVIVNICSVAGQRAAPSVAAYGAAKAGLANLTKTHALEWAPKVRVVAVTPGLVETDSLQWPDELRATIPSDRFCTPHDIARACTWLASEAASYVNCANLVLDGGGDWPAFLRPGG